MTMYAFDAQQFAADLATARDGLPFRAAAPRVGVSHTTLCDIENGRVQPRVRTFLAVCGAFDLSPVDYFTNDDTGLPPGAYALDYDALADALAAKRATVPNNTWRALVANSDVAHVTAWRAGNQRHGWRVATLSTICDWLDTPPGAFLVAAG